MIAHHPSEETLLRLATGTLPTGPALVVSTHIAQCPECRAALRALETVGGALLDDAPEMALTADIDALLADPEAAARRFDGRWSAEKRAVVRQAPAFPKDMVLPAPLAAYNIGRWRMVGPGIQWAKLEIPGEHESKVLLLRARPGTALPLHTHTGTEFTCILYGSFDDEGEQIRVGDLAECDEHDRHQPRVDSEVECICVLSIDGQLVMEGWLARLAQRIVGL
jgi:putative transcriptional regulator